MQWYSEVDIDSNKRPGEQAKPDRFPWQTSSALADESTYDMSPSIKSLQTRSEESGDRKERDYVQAKVRIKQDTRRGNTSTLRTMYGMPVGAFPDGDMS